MLPFRHVPHLQGLLPVLHQGEHEGLFPGCRLVQPLRRVGTEGFPADDAFHEAARLREMYRHHLRRQYHDPRVPQRPQVFQQGVRRARQGWERHDGMVPRFQAAPAVQRFGRGHNILPHRGERGRQGRTGVERVRQAPLRESVCRQGVYQERTLRVALRPRHTPRTRAEGKHEEQADAYVGQNHAPQEVRHRVYQRAAQEQGKPRALKAPVRPKLHNEHLFGSHCILFLRQQAGSVARPYRELHPISPFLTPAYPELA